MYIFFEKCDRILKAISKERDSTKTNGAIAMMPPYQIEAPYHYQILQSLVFVHVDSLQKGTVKCCCEIK